MEAARQCDCAVTIHEHNPNLVVLSAQRAHATIPPSMCPEIHTRVSVHWNAITHSFPQRPVGKQVLLRCHQIHARLACQIIFAQRWQSHVEGAAQCCPPLWCDARKSRGYQQSVAQNISSNSHSVQSQAVLWHIIRALHVPTIYSKSREVLLQFMQPHPVSICIPEAGR